MVELNNQQFCTVLMYLNEIQKEAKKNLRYDFAAELPKLFGLNQSFTPMGVVGPAMRLSKIFGKPPIEVMQLITSRSRMNAAVDDMISYSVECGINAYDARIQDKEEKQEINFLTNIEFLKAGQSINIISLRDMFVRFAGIYDKKPDKVSDPLANMADEDGVVEGYHITE